MDSSFILLNGPMGCGKTELVKHLNKSYMLGEYRCKDKLFRLVQEFFSISEERFWEVYLDRDMKEVPLAEYAIDSFWYYGHLDGIIEMEDRPLDENDMVKLSVREAMIFVSECICKPIFGNDYFGKARAKDFPNKGGIGIDDSAGFVEELPPIIDKVGNDNCLLIRIHGRGTFDGDSRNYIPDGVINNTVDVYNTNTEEEFKQNVATIIDNWLEQKYNKGNNNG